MRFVPPVPAGGSEKFLPAVQISPFSFFVFLSLKLLKLGESDNVKVKSDSVKFWTNLMSAHGSWVFSSSCMVHTLTKFFLGQVTMHPRLQGRGTFRCIRIVK